MSRFIRLFSVFAVVALLGGVNGGCAQLQEFTAKAKAVEQKVVAGVKKVASSKIDRRKVTAGAKFANLLITTGDIYLQQPICNGTTVVCRNSAATEPLIKVKTSLSSARNKALQFMLDHP